MVLSFVLEIVTVCLGVTSFALTIAIVAAPTWRISSATNSASSVSFITFQEGLWARCTSVGKGTSGRDSYWQCDHYENAVVGVPAYLDAFRALMIIALIACFAGVVFSILGMRCSNLVKENSESKRKIIIIGGICHISSGVLTGISVSWYAAEVVREYYSIYYQTQKVKYTLGACLYIGWVTMILELACGCLMTFCTCYNNPADDEHEEGYGAGKAYGAPPYDPYKTELTATKQNNYPLTRSDRQSSWSTHSSDEDYDRRRSSRGRYRDDNYI